MVVSVKTLLLLLSVPLAATAQTRYHEYTEKFANPDDGVEIISASYFGGPGHEWLAAGAFAPDGTVVLAGNVLGPEFGAAEVLGKDGEPPPVPVREAETDSKGKPKLNKDGTPRLLPLSWISPGATGYIVRTSPDLKMVISTHRLPWQSGVITSCVVATDGAIYIAGKAGENIDHISGDTKELAAGEDQVKSAGTNHTFLARLSPDASQVLWLRHLKGASNAPRLELLNDGSLKFSAQDLRNISPSGEEIARLTVPGGPGHLTAVNPADGSVVRGGEHHSPTGREPWRCPTLDVFNPDGTRRHQLYDWSGPYVGLDSLRLVSDTAVRRVTFDNEGDIVLYLWSDGGNSVALREPFDIYATSRKSNGLGFGAWGAGVLSAAYLVKIDPLTYRIKNGTMWMSYLEDKNKPNSAWIDQLAFAPDGSACFTGRAANSIIQTSDRLSPIQSGQHVAILRSDLSSIRFCTAIPGAGAVTSGNANETWGIASSRIGNKQRVLFLTGSSGESDGFETPLLNSSRKSYGGGWSDGYALLVEMDLENTPSQPAERSTPSDWTTTSEGPATTFADKKGRGPEPGQSFTIAPKKWVTADAEFRDPSGKLWPSFLCGKPESGTFTFEPANPSLTAIISCDRLVQPEGSPTARVLGPTEILDPKDSDLAFEILSIGTFETRTEIRTNGKKQETRQTLHASSDCVLHLAGRSVSLKGETRFSFQYPRTGNLPESVRLETIVTTTSEVLGLKNPPPGAEIKIRITTSAEAGN